MALEQTPEDEVSIDETEEDAKDEPVFRFDAAESQKASELASAGAEGQREESSPAAASPFWWGREKPPRWQASTGKTSGG